MASVFWAESQHNWISNQPTKDCTGFSKDYSSSLPYTYCFHALFLDSIFYCYSNTLWNLKACSKHKELASPYTCQSFHDVVHWSTVLVMTFFWRDCFLKASCNLLFQKDTIFIHQNNLLNGPKKRQKSTNPSWKSLVTGYCILDYQSKYSYWSLSWEIFKWIISHTLVICPYP